MANLNSRSLSNCATNKTAVGNFLGGGWGWGEGYLGENAREGIMGMGWGGEGLNMRFYGIRGIFQKRTNDGPIDVGNHQHVTASLFCLL